MTQKKKIVFCSYFLLISVVGTMVLIFKDKNSYVMSMNISKETQQPTEQELINQFLYDDSIEGGKAILERGERMIPLLMKLKGNRDFFWPLGLGNPGAAKAWQFPVQGKGAKLEEGKSVYDTDTDTDVVTQEVAALYLICAIYHKNLQFAQNPLLTDLSLPPEKRRARNTKELVDKAWIAAEAWAEAMKKEGLSSLQAKHHDPLRGSNVAFW